MWNISDMYGNVELKESWVGCIYKKGLFNNCFLVLIFCKSGFITALIEIFLDNSSLSVIYKLSMQCNLSDIPVKTFLDQELFCEMYLEFSVQTLIYFIAMNSFLRILSNLWTPAITHTLDKARKLIFWVVRRYLHSDIIHENEIRLLLFQPGHIYVENMGKIAILRYLRRK